MGIKYCRICKSNILIKVISLGNQKNTSIFPKYGEIIKETYPIDLVLCNYCELLQLYETTPSHLMYETGGYGYKSSISNTMRKHLTDYKNELMSKIELKSNDIVVDIGSNDGFTLKLYNRSIRRIGIDPTGNQFKEFYTDNIELLPNYFTLENFKKQFGDIKVNVVTSISMFYDLPDPVQFAKDIYQILDKNGIWSCEQSYLLYMLDKNSMDTICHEHLEYYSLKQIKEIADRANFKIIDVKFNDCNGGSFRIYFSKKESEDYFEAKELINQILNNERKYNLKDIKTYTNFIENCDYELKKLTNFIDYIKYNNKTIQLYGASTKGNCVLQYCNITEDKVKYAVERNPSKFGYSTSTGIKIISEEKMRKNPPDFLIVLPWHFKREIIERESEYLKNGGQLIFYFPNFEIISLKPKLLITGCDGFIAEYIKENYKEFQLYGITRTLNKIEKNILKFNFDMNNFETLELIIKTINPDKIIHLASISSSIDAYNNPFSSLQNNGMLVAKICEIIFNFNKNIKLFNASSSEIYKGHQNYIVSEELNIDNTNHLHPYSIAKIMGQNIIKFYRENYGLNFSNGIIFTTQSIKKKNIFLINKIFDHLKKNKEEELIVGNLSSYRNIIHPYDVSTAIKFILDHDHGSDYLICNYKSYKIEDIVKKIYKIFNITLIKSDKENIYYNKTTNKKILIIENENNGLDKKSVDIKGYPNKLKQLGWEIKYDINKILGEFK